jgi:hypothetical protein
MDVFRRPKVVVAEFAAPGGLGAALLARVRCEFLEMPGLRLTVAQAARLWDVDRHTACALLQALVDVRFLSQGRDGSYARWSA